MNQTGSGSIFQDGLVLPSGISLLVERYRAGIQSAGDELLIRFHPYLTKWLRLLIHGRWDGRDGEVRHFLEMLGCLDIRVTAQILATRLRCYEPADLEQEVRVALLETALKCRSIRKQYRYLLRDRIAQCLKDPLTRGYYERVSWDGEEELGGALRTHPEGEVPLNMAWLQGLTCGPGFDELTILERAVLRYNKGFGYSIARTADALGVSASTVDRAIRHAKGILRVHYLS